MHQNQNHGTCRRDLSDRTRLANQHTQPPLFRPPVLSDISQSLPLDELSPLRGRDGRLMSERGNRWGGMVV